MTPKEKQEIIGLLNNIRKENSSNYVDGMLNSAIKYYEKL